jgi:valyl-tRNA synthetase
MTNIAELPNRFDYSEAAQRIYQFWEDGGYFQAEVDSTKKPYTIVIPPPNVTGALHLGHALNNTLQDIQIRMHRMQGFNTLWMPGTDHAGIATQAVVERRLREEEGKTRHDLGREKLVERIWEWKQQYETRILGQLKQMGCSCDWTRTRFTLDDTCARAVRHTFFSLFNEDKIYRGKRLVNWDTFLGTAVSDDEVFTEKTAGHLWHLSYEVIDPQAGEPKFVTIATTRPETMLGDTAVAVHPNPSAAFDKSEAEMQRRIDKAAEKDKADLASALANIRQRRTDKLATLETLRDMAVAGRQLRLPLIDRVIPLLADEWAKPEMGSGCVKITPAHDPNDYMVGQRNGLPMINILNPDGTMNENAGAYRDLKIPECREKIVADMDALGQLAEVEEHEIELPYSDRSKTPIEPFLANQWFVRMAELAQSAMDAVADGRVNITPARYQRTYHDWLAEKRDWPVSRQLWWGHQIPVWSKGIHEEAEVSRITDLVRGHASFASGTIAIQEEDPREHADGTEEAKQALPIRIVHVCIRDENDEAATWLEAQGFERVSDVLDTWFSSALWTHSTLGWPESNEDLDYFYPTATLITSRDILTLWVARMVLMGLHNRGEIPFSDVFIHPKILDGDGETMSKSKGNGIDPLDVIDKFGPDALRFAMAHLTTETQDVRMPVEFECPSCEVRIAQTKKNRTQHRIKCPKCKSPFSTQWAESDEDKALPRGGVVTERFEQARNFGNKLWNAARFAIMNLEGYEPGEIDIASLPLEDRWMLSRLATVTTEVTTATTEFHYADAARALYSFAWDEFCSFYIEIAKGRLAQDDTKQVAQRVLAAALDTLLRLLHPIMPFITEEIWQLLNEAAPKRGFALGDSTPTIMIATWPEFSADMRDAEIERQFAVFQSALGAVRELRSRQNIPPKAEVEFWVRTDKAHADLLANMAQYFAGMSNSNVLGIGPDVQPESLTATVSLPDMEIIVNLKGFLDVEAETARQKKEIDNLIKMIGGKENKLSNAKFVDRAPADVVEKERESLAQLKQQLQSAQEALERFVAASDK